MSPIGYAGILLSGVTDRASFNKGGSNADNGYEENTGSIVIVLIERPKDQTSNLEDVERVKGLKL